jgi:hypothetical protein
LLFTRTKLIALLNKQTLSFTENSYTEPSNNGSKRNAGKAFSKTEA